MTRRRLVQAQDMRRTPPDYTWLRGQPAGWVAEIKIAWTACLRREAYEVRQEIERQRQGGV